MGVITRVQLLGTTIPLKLGRAKNVQNLVRFTTIFEFDRKYLWNEWSYRQAAKVLSSTINTALNKKKLVKFGPLTPEITRLMFTHPKSTVRILRILMHVSACVSRDFATGGNFTRLPLNSPPMGLRAPGGLRWALPQISSFISVSPWPCEYLLVLLGKFAQRQAILLRATHFPVEWSVICHLLVICLFICLSVCLSRSCTLLKLIYMPSSRCSCQII